MKQMKKLVLLLAILMPSITIFGQTSKGNLVISGGTGLQFVSSSVKSVYDGKTGDEYTVTSFSLIPSFGYFVMDNLALGLSSTFSSSTQKDEDGNKYTSSSVLFVPTALYYFTLDEKIKPLAQIGIGYSTMTNKYIPKTGSDEKNTGSGLAINFGGGISYFVSKNISFNFGLSYTISTLTDGDDDKSKLKQGNLGSNIGISVFF
jgi:outer membrane protein